MPLTNWLCDPGQVTSQDISFAIFKTTMIQSLTAEFCEDDFKNNASESISSTTSKVLLLSPGSSESCHLETWCITI